MVVKVHFSTGFTVWELKTQIDTKILVPSCDECELAYLIASLKVYLARISREESLCVMVYFNDLNRYTESEIFFVCP